jgi:hypothetical protein
MQAGVPSVRECAAREGSIREVCLVRVKTVHTSCSGHIEPAVSDEDVESWREAHESLDDGNLGVRIKTGLATRGADAPLVSMKSAGWHLSRATSPKFESPRGFSHTPFQWGQ